MKLQLKCDRCGKIGTEKEVYPVGHFFQKDLCRKCELELLIEDAERDAKGEQEAADEHLATVRAIREQIEAYKAEIATLS